MTACGEHGGDRSSEGTLAEERVLNVYNWADNIGETTIADFEARTGIKVTYDIYESNEVLETKLLTGHTGYDVVVPSAGFLGRQIKAGVFRKLDKSKLPNLANLDPEIMRQVAVSDPANEHAINYLWGTTGIGYNPAMVKKAIGTDRIDSWSALFDPDVASKLAKCGIAMLDDPADAFDAALIYLDLELDENRDRLAAAEELLTEQRPHVRYYHSSQPVNDLATGAICVSLNWSGNVHQAQIRGAAAERPVVVAYAIPREGAIGWYDMMAIPADAPHPDNAHVFLNYLMEPEVIAGVSNAVGFANGNSASLPYVDEQLRNDPTVYPGPATRKMLRPFRTRSQEYSRDLNRAWTRIKTGQ